MNPQTTDTDRLHFLAHRSFRAPGPTKFHPVYCIVDSSVWAPRPCVPNEKLNALREAIDASMPPSAEPRHAPADSASAQLAAINVQLNWPLPDSPFNKFACTVADVGYADKILSVDCPEALSQLAAMREELELTQQRYAAFQLHTETTMAAAQSEVGRLKQTHLDCIDELSAQANIMATLRRERDQARQDLEERCAENDRERAAHLQAYEAAVKERDELREDKERLDWLEHGGCEVLCHKPADDDTDQRPVFWVRGYLDGTPRTLRSALDSARAKQGEGQPEDAKEGRK